MATNIPITRRSLSVRNEVERTMRTIFKRCVDCPDESPSCPPCSKSEICSLVPADCNNCASMVCVRNPSPSPASTGPNVGAIAGGVLGGIAFVAIIVFLLWLFFRPGDLRDSTYSGNSDFTDRRDTQYTRASITPSLARSSIASGIYTNNVDPMPAQQVVRAAPRMVSVKTTFSASPSSETPGSASGETPTSSADTAQFAANTPAGKGKPVQVMMPGQGERSATGSVKSNASYGKAQQITLGGKSKGRFPISRDGSTSSSKHAPSVSSPLADADAPPTSSPSYLDVARDRSPTVLSPINASPASQPAESPFFDASEAPAVPSPAAAAIPRPNPYASMTSSVTRSREERAQRGGRGPGGLSAVIEEATKRASRVVSHEGLGGKRDSSPFTDAHRTD